jgi:hypothetical protein
MTMSLCEYSEIRHSETWMPSPLELEYRKRFTDQALVKKALRVQLFRFLDGVKKNEIILVKDAFYERETEFVDPFPIELVMQKSDQVDLNTFKTFNVGPAAELEEINSPLSTQPISASQAAPSTGTTSAEAAASTGTTSAEAAASTGTTSAEAAASTGTTSAASDMVPPGSSSLASPPTSPQNEVPPQSSPSSPPSSVHSSPKNNEVSPRPDENEVINETHRSDQSITFEAYEYLASMVELLDDKVDAQVEDIALLNSDLAVKGTLLGVEVSRIVSYHDRACCDPVKCNSDEVGRKPKPRLNACETMASTAGSRKR